MQKINHIKVLGNLYSQKKNIVSIVNVPAMKFLMINGTGNPNNNPDYSKAVGALYSLAYAIKFHVKKGSMQTDYKVMPLEGLWWADDMTKFNMVDRHLWKWTMMIMQPDFITKDIFHEMQEETIKKKKDMKIIEVHLEEFQEGTCVQIFHMGPYGEAEAPAVKKLHDRIQEEGFVTNGKHHELYFNSPLRTAPENLKTIIRQPFKKE